MNVTFLKNSFWNYKNSKTTSMQMCAITIEEKTSGKTNEVEAKGKFLFMENTLEV